LTITSLGEGGRLWQFGGAAVLDVPGTHIMAVDSPNVPRGLPRHAVLISTHFGGAHWIGQCVERAFRERTGSQTKSDELFEVHEIEFPPESLFDASDAQID
jgi:hypothetical protein